MADSFNVTFPENGTGNGSGNGTGQDAGGEHNPYFDFILFHIVVPVLFLLITLVGLIGNALVIYVIISRHKMRTVTNLLLLNLAVADLSFVLVIPPFTAYQFAAQMFPFGAVPCKMMHFLVNVTAYVTVYTLVLISVIRYMTIVHNHSTMRIRTKCNVIIMIISIWVVMLLVNIPILFSYGIKYFGDIPDCDLYDPDDGKKIFSTFFVFAYILPLFIIALFSIAILRHIQKQRPASIKSKTSKKKDKKKRASQMLILVVVIFAVLWLPIHIHLLNAFFGTAPSAQWYSAVSVLFNCLAYFNSCVNPMIYNRASKEFRDAFREVVCCLQKGHGENGYQSAMSRGPQDTTTTRVSTSPARATSENGKDGAAGTHLLADDEKEPVQAEEAHV